MFQPVLSLIQIYLKSSKQRKNKSCDESREKTRAFRGHVYEILERTIRFKTQYLDMKLF